MASLPQPASSSHVNLHCLQCGNHLGIFDNEWSRLTTSYAQPVLPGTHLGTEVANKTQIVPEGVAQRALEGCSLAEVFCTGCSASVGHYCKAAPNRDQRRLVNQYFYKLSKTVLKDSDSSGQVEPIFAFSGDFARLAPRSKANSRPSLPPTTRLSQTPLPRDSTPLYPQSKLDQLRMAPPAHSDPRDLVQLDRRLKAQEDKLHQQNRQIHTLTSLIDSFQEALDEVKTSVQKLNSQNSVPPSAHHPHADFVAGLESMVQAFKNTRTGTEEIDELRAEVQVLRSENASLKSKWDRVQSAMATATEGDIQPTSQRNALGKRKRDSDLLRSETPRLGHTVRRTTARTFDEFLSSSQILTPEESNYSDSHVQDASNSSRTSTPDERQGASQAQNNVARPTLIEEPAEHEGGNAASVPQAEDRQSPFVRFAPTESVFTLSQVETSGRQSHSKQTQPATDEGDLETPEETTAVTDVGQVAGTEPSIDLDAAESPHNDMPTGNGVEFSDEEESSASTSHRPLENSTAPAQSQAAAVPDGETSKAAPGKRTRGTTRTSSRRKTDSVLEDRSVAPEPKAFPRIMPRRLSLNQLGQFENWTPDKVEQELQGPRLPRPRKPYVQSTEKILVKELIELGLEEWVSKDRHNPEYKKAITEARIRQREKNKLAKLASRGIGVGNEGGSSERDGAPAPSNPLEDALREANALANALVKPVGPHPAAVQNTAKPASPPGSLTRKMRREEEMRRRDQLASEAMDMDD